MPRNLPSQTQLLRRRRLFEPLRRLFTHRDVGSRSRPAWFERLERRRLLSGYGDGFQVYTDAGLSTVGLTGSYVDQDLKDNDELDWRSTQTIAGTRIDPVLFLPLRSFGTRADVGLTGGTDEDWDNFSVQWDGVVHVEEAGIQLATISSDGSRMWIDVDSDATFEPEELIDNNFNGEFHARTSELTEELPAGVYPIRIQFREAEHANHFSLVADPISGQLPFQLFTNDTLSTTGLTGSYVDRSLEVVDELDWRATQVISGTRVDESLSFRDHDWGNRAEVGVTGGTDDNWEDFAVQWDGVVQIDVSGTQLGTWSDDASRLWIDTNQNGAFESVELVDNNWGAGQAVTVGPPSQPLEAGIYPIRVQYNEIFFGNLFELRDVTRTVRVAYHIPSDRSPQASAPARFQEYLPRLQSWFGEQMDRWGFGEKTFRFETEADNVTPKVHVVHSGFTADQPRHFGDMHDALAASGIPFREHGQVWWVISEQHTQRPDGVIENTAFHGSPGNGGLFISGSEMIFAMAPEMLVNDQAFMGQVVPELGPHPLAQFAFPGGADNTFSEVASRLQATIGATFVDALWVDGDLRNHEFGHGNLSALERRGFRGSLHPDLYPTEDARLSLATAAVLNRSQHFNTDRVTDAERPTVVVTTGGAVDSVDGHLQIDFTASDNEELALAVLQNRGFIVAEMELSGTQATGSFLVPYYEPGSQEHYRVRVYDAAGLERNEGTDITVNVGANRAPQPSIKALRAVTTAGQTITLDASASTDPDHDVATLTVEWDLDGDGVFDTAPSTSKTLETSFTETGTRRVAARVTDPSGAQSVSAPIALRILPAASPEVTLTVDNATVAEAESATLTATLSERAATAVTVDLGFSGTATDAADYVVTGTRIVIPAGQLSGSITLTALPDSLTESNETVVVEITTVAGALESVPQQQTVTITDGGLLCDTSGVATCAILPNNILVAASFDDVITRHEATTGERTDFLFPELGVAIDNFMDLAFAADGDLYAATRRNVLRYDGTTFEFKGVFADAVSSELVFGPQGDLFTYYDRFSPDIISRYDGQTGEFESSFVVGGDGGLTEPLGFTFGPGGDFYVVHENADGNAQVLRFNGSTGAFVGVFVDAGVGGLTSPVDVTMGPNGHLYVVVDPDFGSVLEYDAQGAFVGVFVASGSGGLVAPGRAVFGPNGDLFITDTLAESVLRFNGETGAFLNHIVTDGFVVGGVAVSPAGEVLVPLGGAPNRIGRYTSNGTFLSNAVTENTSRLNQPNEMVIGPDDHVYVIDNNRGVFQINPFTRETQLVVPSGGGLFQLSGMDFGPDGLLYVTSRGGDSVQRFDPLDWSLVDTFVPAGSGGLDRPESVLFGPDGDLYVSESATDRVKKYDGTTGAYLGDATSGSGGNKVDIRFGPDGNLYILSNLSSSSTNVLRYDPRTGEHIDIFVPTGVGGLGSFPGQLVFGTNGDLYVNDFPNVARFDGITGEFIGSATSQAQGDNGLAYDGALVEPVRIDAADTILRVIFAGTGGGIDPATIGTGDVLVTGPDGLTHTPELVRINDLDDAVIARYRLAAPRGTFDARDNGSYVISVQANEVRSLAGDTVPAGILGAFSVSLPPIVKLSVDTSEIQESGGVALVTATLSTVSTNDVAVDISFGGTAILDTDFTTSARQIIVPAGSTTGSIALTALADAISEAAETVDLEVTGVSNGTEFGNQQVTVAINDDTVVTHTVTNTNDSGPGSLRQAIEDANARTGPDVIAFQIPTSDPGFVDVDSGLAGGDADADVFVIQPLTVLPPLNDAFGGTEIDGQTQAAFAGDTNPFGPEIAIDGSLTGLVPAGLQLVSDENELHQLNIRSFEGDGVRVTGSRNLIRASFVGTDATGTQAAGNAEQGIFVLNGAENRIGGPFPEDQNLVSGNVKDGVNLFGETADGNVVQGNLVGTDASGTLDLGNGFVGIRIAGGADANLALQNVVSGQDVTGIEINQPETVGNVLTQNLIGTDTSGLAAIPNANFGVAIFNSIDNLVSSNVVAASTLHGVFVSGADASGNYIVSNRIGTDATGTRPLGNTAFGIMVANGAHNNLIGTDGDGIDDESEGNLISGNGSGGVWFTHADTRHNVLAGNRIGTDLAGTGPLGNGDTGVEISDGAHHQTIGGAGDFEGNLISANVTGGIWIHSGAHSNSVQGNQIGTTIDPDVDLGNGGSGILIQNASNNLIGETPTISLPRDFDTQQGTNGLFYEAYADHRMTNVLNRRPSAAIEQLPLVPSETKFAGDAVHTGPSFQGTNGGFPYLQLDETTNTLILHNGTGGSDLGTGTSHLGASLAFVAPAAGEYRFSGSFARANTFRLAGNGVDVAVIRGEDVDNPLFSANISPDHIVNQGEEFDGTGVANFSVNVPLEQDEVVRFVTFADAQGQDGTFDAIAFKLDVFNAGLAGNLIAFNVRSGVQITNENTTFSGSGNAIRGNSIHSNTGLGIDLGGDGVTPNDPLDEDGSPNDFQNFPEIQSVVSGAVTQISGTLGSQQDQTYLLDFYANDTTALAEGKRYLGSTTVTTDLLGVGAFAVSLDTETSPTDFITATATDPAGNTSEFSAAFAPGLNAAPTFDGQLNVTIVDGDGFGLPVDEVGENDLVQLLGFFEDADLGDRHTIAIDWGDGTSQTFCLTSGAEGPCSGTEEIPDAPPRIFAFLHQYPDDRAGAAADLYQISVTVDDELTRSAGGGPTQTFDLTVTNSSPALDTGSLSSSATMLREGDTITLTGTFVDEGPDDTHVLMVDWGDGTPVEFEALPLGARSFQISHRYADDRAPLATPVLVTLTDDDGGSDSATLSLDVTNVAPVAVINALPGPLLEGETITLTATVIDPGSGDVPSYAWSVTRDGTLYATGSEPSFPLVADDQGTYVVSLTVNDGDGGSHTADEVSLAVGNAPPRVEGSNLRLLNETGEVVSTISEGDTILLAGEFTDGGLRDTHQLTIDWGDGQTTGPIDIGSGERHFNVTHLYDDDPAGDANDYPIVVTVTDNDGASGSGTRAVTVLNVPPILTIVDDGSTEEVVSLAGEVVDPGADTFTYVWEVQARGVPITPQDSSGNAVPTDGSTLSFALARSTLYAVSLTVQDDDGGRDSQTISYVGGTELVDEINVIPTADDGEVEILVTTQNQTFNQRVSAATPIIVTAFDGDDMIKVSEGVTTSVVLNGGAGDDVLYGGGGNDSLIGTEGDDVLAGGPGDDVFYLVPGSDKALTENPGEGFDIVDFSMVFAPGGIRFDLGLKGAPQVVDDRGNTVTLQGDFEGVVGTRENDTLNGNLFANLVNGGQGEDVIMGGTGDDTLLGGDGNDRLYGNLAAPGAGGGRNTLHGGRGNDLLFGGNSTDLLFGDSGDDTIQGNGGNDRIFGDNLAATDGMAGGRDSLDGGAGDDLIFGGGNVDELRGGAGNDRIEGGDGNDRIFGGDDIDLLMGDAGQDSIEGGAGNDVIFGGDDIDLLSGDAGDDELHGDTGNDSIHGGAGNDLIFGGDDIDLLIGDSGDDSIEGGAGNDLIFGGDNTDELYGGEGDDTAVGGAGSDYIEGGAGNDRIFGDTEMSEGAPDSRQDTVSGGAGDDVIFGGDDIDLLMGDSGDDTIEGGAGNDLIFGGDDIDTLHGEAGSDSIQGGAGNDLIFGDGQSEPGAGAQRDTVAGGDGDDVIFGGDDLDVLRGDAGHDTIEGGAGNDLIFGGDDIDLLSGEAGDDQIRGDAGRDSIEGGAGNDLIWGDVPGEEQTSGRHQDTISGSDGNDQIFGGDDIDLLMGDDGQDSIEGGAGNDLIFGGDDIDLLMGDQGNDELDGGQGQDSIEGGAGNDLIFGGEDPDMLTGDRGNDRIEGGPGDDIVFGGTPDTIFAEDQSDQDSIIGGDGSDTIFGGDDIDLLQGDAGEDTIQGGAGNDLIFGGDGTDRLVGDEGDDRLEGDAGANVLLGGLGNDTLRGGDGDELIDGGGGTDAGGQGFIDWVEAAADNDFVITDTSLVGDGTDQLANVEGARLTGGPGNNRFDATAFSGDTVIEGGDGDDTLLGSNQSDSLAGGSGDDLLIGGAGDDTYLFVGLNLGNDTVDETPQPSPDDSQDELNFFGFPDPIRIDLAETSSQGVSPNLRLSLTSGSGIENIVGTVLADDIQGNDRNNLIIGAGGQDVLSGEGGDDVLQAGIVKQVFLDFDSATNVGEEPGAKEEEVFEAEDRTIIQSLLEQDFAKFDITFTHTRPERGPFVTVRFNETPVINGRFHAGGRSPDIGFRNVERDGVVIVDVNGFFGMGIENTRIRNELPLTTNSRNNFISLSATIAAHELAHFFGLRHHDAFGPIGGGVYAERPLQQFLPAYPAGIPRAATETIHHISASPPSVGTTLADALSNPFFGEREAIKLAFADTGTVLTELPNDEKSAQFSLNSDGDPSTPRRSFAMQFLGQLPPLTVPNTLEPVAENFGMAFEVQAAAVQGKIQLDETTQSSESDFYVVYAQAGFLTVEVLSDSLRRINDPVDAMLRVWDLQTGEKLNYHGSPLGAFNDDGLDAGNRDPLLLDVPIDRPGFYIVEVDSFQFGSVEWPEYAPPEFDVEFTCQVNPQRPDCLDTIEGTYELFLYQFDAVSSPTLTSGDSLRGGPGADTMIGSSGHDTFVDENPDEGDVIQDSSGVRFRVSVSAGSDQSLTEGDSLAVNASFEDLNPGAVQTHRAVIDWGDGTVEEFDSVSETVNSSVPHLYANEGTFTVSVLVTNTTNGLFGLDSFLVTVQNAAPTIDQFVVPADGQEGGTLSLSASASDLGALDELTYTWTFSLDGETRATLVGREVSFIPPDNGIYDVVLTVDDGDGGTATQSTTLPIANVAPLLENVTATTPVNEGDLVSLSAAVSSLSGAADSHTFLWTVRQPDGTPAATLEGSNASFVPDDDGNWQVELAVTDDDLSTTTETLEVTVVNAPPAIRTITIPAQGQTGTPVTLEATADDPANENDPLTFTWTVAGPESFTLVGESVVFTPTQVGTFDVTLLVTDDDAGFAQQAGTVTVDIPPEITSLTVPTNATEGEQLTLQASAVNRRGIGDLVYTWSAESPQGSALIATGPDLNSVVWNPPDDGPFNVELEVRAGDNRTASASRAIAVVNADPTITGFTVPLVADEGAAVALSATLTDAGVDDVLSYQWTVSATGEAPLTFTGTAAPGEDIGFEFTPVDNLPYDVELEVTDDDGGSVQQSQTVTVNNVAPVIVELALPTAPSEGVPITLAPIVTDPAADRDPPVFEWSVSRAMDVDFELTSSEPVLTFVPPDNDQYSITLRVTDGDGGEASQAFAIDVRNAAPVIETLNVPSRILTGTEVITTAGVVDLGDDVITYAWDFGDGAQTIGTDLARVSHTYAENGTYPISLTVTDEDGGSHQLASTVVVAGDNAVEGVFLRGTAWDDPFLDWIDERDLGHSHIQRLGYAVPGGPNQLQTIPWTTADVVSIKFTGDMVVGQEDLRLSGVSGADYAITDFEYDSRNFIASWTLSEPIGRDITRLELSDLLVSVNNLRLDGEWVTASSVFPSGDGRPGGLFGFEFIVLPADGDRSGSVDISDAVQTQQRLFACVGEPGYSGLFDFNGDGCITISDALEVRSRLFTSRPSDASAARPAPEDVLDRLFADPSALDEVVDRL